MPTVLAVAASALVVPLAAPSAASAAPATDYTQFVNPFIGTQGDHGHDGPGAIAPYGLATVTPNTQNPSNNPTGYDYDGTTYKGFSNIALDGVGGGGGAGDFLVVPTYQSFSSRPSTGGYDKQIRTQGGKKIEEAHPGFYSVSTTESGKQIDAKATAATRTGVQDFTFGSAGHASLVVDLQHNIASGGRKAADLTIGTSDDGNTTISGSFTAYFYRSYYKLYYYAETTAPTSTVQTWNGSTLGTSSSQDGTDIGAVLNFDATAGEDLGLRVTLSPISVDQAKRDAAVEVQGKTFDQVYAATKAEWNARLGKVEVDATTTNDPSGDLKTEFYSHLYRLADTPMNATSTDGTYRGADGGTYKADGYTHYDSWSLWDDFHKYAGIASVFPDVYADTVQSLVDLYASVNAGGATSVSALTQSVPTVRFERAPVVVADAISKGVTLHGLAQAYPVLAAQTGDPASLTNLDSQAGGVTGYAYDAYGMSIIANALGKTADAQKYLDGAARWAKVFDKDALVDNANAKAATGVAAGVDKVGLIMPRSSDSDTASFNVQDPEAWQVAHLYQGTLWQYNWYDAADLGGVVDMLGGKADAAKAVNYYFGTYTSDCTRMLHLYANEISVHAPFLFNYVGQPSATQDLTYKALTEPVCTGYNADGGHPTSAKGMIYQNTPDGMLRTMDNDAGTMSGYFVSTAMGMYPVATGGDTYELTSPIFDKVTVHYPGGKDLVIEAPGVSSSNHYIQSATLNGSPLNRTWLTSSELTNGGVLTFTMGSSPSIWGADGAAADSVNDHVSSALYHPSAPVSTSQSVFQEARLNDGSIDSTVTVTSKDVDLAGADGADLTSQVTASGVPSGLVLRATKTGARTLELSLVGKATHHLVSDDTDNLQVVLKPTVFAASAPSAADRTLALKVRFDGYRLDASTQTVTADESGTVSASVKLALTGGVTFSGSTGAQLPASAVSFPGLADGLSATVTKTSATTARLAVSGTLTHLAKSSFVVDLADAALSGAKAADVSGAGTTALSPFTVAVPSQARSDLQVLYDDARLVTKDNYSAASFSALSDAVATAKAALADPSTSDYDLGAARAALQAAVEGLEIAPEFPTLTPNNVDGMAATLGRDPNGGPPPYTNFGATHDELWAEYKNVDLGDGVTTFTFNYDKPSSRSTDNTWIDLRFGSPTGTTVASTPMLAYTGSGWGTYATQSISVDPSVFKGTKDVYVVFRSDSDNTSGAPYVGNFAWFTFGVGQTTSTTVQFESLQASNGTFAGDSNLVAGEDYQEGSNGVDPSKDGLKTENNNSGRTLSGVTTGAWVRYQGVDLGSASANKVEITYDAPSGKANDPQVALYVDDMDGSPVASGHLATTGSSWGTYTTAVLDLDHPITGEHTLYWKFTSGAPNDPQLYVGNFDSFALVSIDTGALQAAVDQYASLTSQGDLYLDADFGVFTRAYEAAQALLTDQNATGEDVHEALRTLDLAAGQLQWKVIKQVDDLVDQASHVKESDVTEASYEALQSAVAAAQALDPSSSTHEQYESVYTQLSSAFSGLAKFYAPTLVLPSTAVSAGAKATVTGAGFAPEETVTFTWQGSPMLTAPWTATTDDSGNVTSSVTVPASAVSGTYTLSASGTDSATPVTARLVVTGRSVVPTRVSVGAPVVKHRKQVWGAKKKARAVLSSVVAGASAGTVTFRSGSTVLGSARVGASHVVSVRLARKLAVGKYHRITATFVASDGRSVVSAASASTVKVKKAKIKKLKLKAKKRVKRHHKFTVKVKASKKLSNARKAKGKVKVKVGKKTVKKINVKKLRKHHGKIKVKIKKRFVHGKKLKVKVTFVPKKKQRVGVKKTTVKKKVRLKK